MVTEPTCFGVSQCKLCDSKLGVCVSVVCSFCSNMSIDMKSMIGLKERIPRRWISTRGALLILLGLIANLGLWWSLQLYRTPARVNKVDEAIFGNSTESYYYKQLDYRLGNMNFEDGTNNVTGKIVETYF